MKKLFTLLGFVAIILVACALSTLSASAKETVSKSYSIEFCNYGFDTTTPPVTPDMKVPLQFGILTVSINISENSMVADTYLVRSKRWIRINNSLANRRYYALGREKLNIPQKLNC